MKSNSDLIRESLIKQNQLIDKEMQELRGDSPSHFFCKPLSPKKELTAMPQVAVDLANVTSNKKSYPGMPELELEDQPELPPEFIFMHDAIFPFGEPVENIDPDVTPNPVKKWWEEDRQYVESDGFTYSGDLSAEEKAKVLADKWRKLAGNLGHESGQ